jgi:cytochrome P450
MTRTADDVHSRIAPGPGGHPITDQLKRFECNPLRFLLDTQREYGDVARLHLWPELYHLVSHPSGMRHVLATNRRNYHGPPLEERGSQRAPAQASGDADISARMSRLAPQVSRQDRLAAMAPLMSNAIESMLVRWSAHADDGEPIDVADELVRLALLVLGETLFKVDLSDELPALIPALGVVLRHRAPQRRVSPYQLLEQRTEPPDLANARRTLSGVISRLVEEGRSAERNDRDLLSRLATDRDEGTGRRLREDDVRTTMLVFLISGHSAVADAMGWAMFLLATNRAAQRRLQTEVDMALGTRQPAITDLSNLPYTLIVLREAMRLYPPVWMFAPRTALRGDRIDGYRIPAGSKILMSPYLTHRHPDFWETPQLFDPERFSGKMPAAFFPFGVGPWSCLGSQFGLLEARMLLASASQRYRWAVAPGKPVELEPQVSLRPRGGLWMIFRRREGREGRAQPRSADEST